MNDEEIKAMIRERILESGMEMTELARRSGYNRNTLYNWLYHGTKFPLSALVDILDVLGGKLEVTM